MLFSFSIIAALLTTISFLPQAIRVIKTKDTSSLSLVMYIMFALGVTIWMIYGIGIRDIAIAVSNFITMIFAVIILFYKVRNRLSGVDEN